MPGLYCIIKDLKELIQHIKLRFEQPLPGRAAQYKMAHSVRQSPRSAPENARIACVLALLYPIEEAWHLVLIQRISNNNPNDRHKGQISFPGGQLEPDDPTLADGALREAKEEVGVDPAKVELLGQLTELYIPVSNFKVYPFAGVTYERPNFRPQLSEVHEILEIPLSDLINPDNQQLTNIRIDEHITLKRVPYYNVADKIVWGATAMMLSEFLEMVDVGINSPG